MSRSSDPDDPFSTFVATVEPGLRRALVAAYGVQMGRDATADSLTWAWENWDRVSGMGNPSGYLYRVGQSSARRSMRARQFAHSEHLQSEARWIEPQLAGALAGLTEHQRVAVVLCHGFEWTHREVAELLGLSPSTVQSHVERALRNLRNAIDGRSHREPAG